MGETEGASHRGLPTPGAIRCTHCGRVSIESERGWEGLHEIGDDGRLVLVVLCGDCAEASRNPDD